jgi:hypothetical protein
MYYLSVFQEQFISKDTKDACKKSCQKIKKYIYKDPKKQTGRTKTYVCIKDYNLKNIEENFKQYNNEERKYFK